MLGVVAVLLSPLGAMAQTQSGSAAAALAVEVGPAIWVLLGTTGLLAGGALVLAWRAFVKAAQAAQEAGLARARARADQTPDGSQAPTALAEAERVWAARFASLESQIPHPPPATPGRVPPSAIGVITARLEEVEITVAKLATALEQLRRVGQATEVSGLNWPSLLSEEHLALKDVREALVPALAHADPSAQALLERLRNVEHWPSARPAAPALALALQEISSQLSTALRHSGLAPLECGRLADRVLLALRPIWHQFCPQVECRTFPPGSTFDPEWMEDHSRVGPRRPIITEMLSWAVFEKSDSGQRVLAKAQVSSD
jgi:hypothetical protein